ncbi:hypothetical protein [Stratiformator vulcanicus]|uniref:Uncharacterized protein n=1 Tax=Stratiformator vulcanicus TaxID=2527980 RepID=A0A517R374_9PLAN|nr:hypothetical protein [Stratiformator vulcanicus]QDT38328.1 hypothetical protein Pan189_27190 [Stratiformator vulcanicus]
MQPLLIAVFTVSVISLPQIGSAAESDATAEPHSVSGATAGTTQGRERTIERIRELERKLDETIVISFKEAPLANVLGEISKRTGITFHINEAALMDDGMDSLQEVSFSTGETAISVRDVVRLASQNLHLALINDSGIAVLTTQTAADDALETRVYNVRDLLEDAAVHRGPLAPLWIGGSVSAAPGSVPNKSIEMPPANELLIVIKSATAGPWMNIDGLGGSIKHFDGLLVVSQTQGVHRELADLFRQLREADKLQSWSEGFPKNTTEAEREAHQQHNEDLFNSPE